MHVPVAMMLLLFSPLLFSQTNDERLSLLKNLNRIAFGSCNNQGDEQPLWKDLIKQKPDLWIWGGDNIYADWTRLTMLEAYRIQNAHPDYQTFKAQTPIIGTWDDHDYAYDNAGGSYESKQEGQRLHLDFVEVPEDSPRRQQEGIYTSYVFGEEEKKIKIIILDNRYFKNLEPDYPMLGKTQWDWLEGQLTTSNAKIHLIATGLPVLSPLIPYTEEWAETSELDRMLDLLKKTKPRGVVFLTGDKHFSSIYRRWGHLEFMSSAMTHTAPTNTWWYLGRQYPVTYFGLSYGQIDIAWEETTPVITLSMRTPSGRDVHKSVFRWEAGRWLPVRSPKQEIFPTSDIPERPL